MSSGRQIGLPFAHDMVCGPPDSGGSSSQAGTTDDMPQGQVDSLVNQLSNEQPTYVLTFNTHDINDGGACIAFLTPDNTIKKLDQSQIPGGSNLTASSDCSKTTLSLGQ